MREDCGGPLIVSLQGVIQIVSDFRQVHVAVMLHDTGGIAFDMLEGSGVVLGIHEVILLGDAVDVAVIMAKCVWCAWLDIVSIFLIVRACVSDGRAERGISLHSLVFIIRQLFSARVHILGTLTY